MPPPTNSVGTRHVEIADVDVVVGVVVVAPFVVSVSVPVAVHVSLETVMDIDTPASETGLLPDDEHDADWSDETPLGLKYRWFECTDWCGGLITDRPIWLDLLVVFVFA